MKPNILIIVMDAVRAQNLPAYGYSRDTTPFLKSIEPDLAVYDNAISSSYWTMPSIASLFTGQYTSSHGLTTDGDRLDPSLITLPALLRRHGYRTAGFVKNIYVSGYSGLDRGFDAFRSECGWDAVMRGASLFSKNLVSRLQPPGITRTAVDAHPDGGPAFSEKSVLPIIARCADVLIDRGSARFVREFGAWLKQNRTTPFFSYFHIFETHSPYRTPLRYALNHLSPAENCRKLFIDHDHLHFLLGTSRLTAEDFRILRASYDNAIRYADHIIERIFRILADNRVLDDTLVVILADHGDNIGEHGLMFHYFCLYDTLIKIPLLIRYPKGTPVAGRVPEVVQNVDIYPTILSLLNIDEEAAWRQAEGNDLLGKVRPARERDLAISELIKAFGPDRNRFRDRLERYNRRLLSLRTSSRKFICSSRGDHECYDLAKDPGEGDNLHGRDVGFTDLQVKSLPYYEKMNGFYHANRDRIDGDAARQVDQSVADKLRPLGYL